VAGQRSHLGYHNLQGAERVRKQITSSAKAVIFAALGYSAGAAALGAGSSSSQSQQQATSGVLAWPGDRAIVIAAGLVIIGVGVASIVKGVKKSFAEVLTFVQAAVPELRSAGFPSSCRGVL
jgi:hypothetical protein